MREVKMPCRIEEIPFLAEFTRDYFVRDRADFTAFSDVFSDKYLQKFDTQIKMVKERMAPALLTAEMKTITNRIRSQYITLRSIVNKVERYTVMAKGTMDTKPANFGFKNLRKKLRLKDDEAVVKKLRELLQHIDKNYEALEVNGLSKAYRQEIEEAINAFEADIIAQTRKIDEREKVVKQNARQFDTLWSMMTEIMGTGKVIYKTKDKARVKDYTYSEMIKKVRLTHIKKEDQLAANKPAKRKRSILGRRLLF
jgi:translation elongation factor EF-1beta